jgi:hypothetical protein
VNERQERKENDMALSDIYTVKAGSIPAYFDALLRAEAPERFSMKFLDALEFKSTNDRAFIGILKDLKFLDADAKPTKLYFEFLDRERSKKVLASAIRTAYSDLFAVNKEAYKFTAQEARNKLRTLYAGSKKDNLIKLIASTFVALCNYADFTSPPVSEESKVEEDAIPLPAPVQPPEIKARPTHSKPLGVGALQYHINIVLPDTRDQAVYDAIFKSLRDHLG